jgi:hypothetical protein
MALLGFCTFGLVAVLSVIPQVPRWVLALLALAGLALLLEGWRAEDNMRRAASRRETEQGERGKR